YEERWKRTLSESAARVYVAETPEGVVGFASGGRERAGEDHYSGELYAIYILRQAQGRGHGRRLVQAVAAGLRELELEDMIVWVQRLGDVALPSERAEDQASDASAIVELRAVFPLLDLGGRDMVPPASPVVPGDEDRNARPQSGGDHSLDLAHGPLAAFAHVASARGSLRRGVGWMLAHHIVGVEPRHGWQRARGCIDRELLP